LAGRVTGGFQYVGPPMDRDNALAMFAARPLMFGDALCERVLAAIPAGGSLRGPRSIALRAGVSPDEASRALARLEKSGDVRAERVGNRWAYVARDVSGAAADSQPA
jgi:hypothetical protein